MDLSTIITGDMPGDKVQIDETHVLRAEKLFPDLLEQVIHSRRKKIVISIFGGSGVGKSEIGSLIAHLFIEKGYGSYVLSGDNYPWRIPSENDAERLKLFENGGKKALETYLGTESEIDFIRLNSIIDQFKNGVNEISLKRMGRTPDNLYYETVDFSDIDILIIEWTHGNNPRLKGVDFPVFLFSTPEETLKHRLSRGRDKMVDSHFTNVVLSIEQALLNTQRSSATLIISKAGEFMTNNSNTGVMINAYPDSCGGSLDSMVALLSKEEFKDTFSSFYILPSMFLADLDRGFSVISYDLNNNLASEEALQKLRDKQIDLKLDFVLNHLSVQSPQFKDLLEKGDESKFIDTFIDWNKFWAGKGDQSSDGYIIPEEQYLSKLFMRKPGLPILKVPFPDGSYRFYWNTFYQKVTLNMPNEADLLSLNIGDSNIVSSILSAIKQGIKNGTPLSDMDFGLTTDKSKIVVRHLETKCSSYLGQMDLNGESETVWDFYDDTFKKLKKYGAKIVRLDAFAYLHKEIGQSNFFNEPGTWIYLDKIKNIADRYQLTLLPEIHSRYQERLHEKLSNKGYPIYDFFFPGLVIHAIEKCDNTLLIKWISEIIDKEYKTVNMLGCHDGIPLIDVKGLLDDNIIEELISIVKSRGGRIKDLFGPDGKKISYYQINSTFFSALGESEKKLLMARAIQLFMPGTPDIWYLDLFAGSNDYEAADNLGHKDINRTNLSMEEIEERLKKDIVKKQLAIIRLRNTHPAFGIDAEITINSVNNTVLNLIWKKGEHSASLYADLNTMSFEIEST